MACWGVVWNLPPAPAEVMERKAQEMLAAAKEAAAQGQPVPYVLLAGPWKDRALLLRRLLMPATVTLAFTLVVAQVAGVGLGGTALLLGVVVAFWVLVEDWRGFPYEPSPPPCLFWPRIPLRLSRPWPVTLPPLHTTDSRISWRPPRPERARQPFVLANPPRRVPTLRLSPACHHPRPMSSNPFSPNRLRLVPISPAPFYSVLFSPDPFCPPALPNPLPFSSAPIQPLPISPAHPNPLPMPTAPFPPALQNPLLMSSVPFPPAPTRPPGVSSTLTRPAPNPPPSLPRKRKREEDSTTSAAPQKPQLR
ncbi:uncharacterized protein LOC144585177 [Pogona vitticeps]